MPGLQLRISSEIFPIKSKKLSKCDVQGVRDTGPWANIFFCTVPLISMHACINSPETVSLRRMPTDGSKMRTLKMTTIRARRVMDTMDTTTPTSSRNICAVCIMNSACCQLFAELFGQSRRKIRPLKGKMRSPSNFNFLKKLGPQKHNFCLHVSREISWTSLELERIWGGKQFL